MRWRFDDLSAGRRTETEDYNEKDKSGWPETSATVPHGFQLLQIEVHAAANVPDATSVSRLL